MVYSAMRTPLLAVVLIATGLLAVAVFVDWGVPFPPIGPGVEQICAETMQRSTPDLSWVAQGREEKVRGREIKAVTLGNLPSHNERLLRVAGVLHAEFEWVALYPSRAAMEEQWRAPWVTLDSLWPHEPYLQTKAPSISDRCVVVEGTYSHGAGGHFGMFNGTIRDVLRLDVWSTPHRPFVTTPPPPRRIRRGSGLGMPSSRNVFAEAPLGAVALLNNFDFSSGDSMTRDGGWTEIEN